MEFGSCAALRLVVRDLEYLNDASCNNLKVIRIHRTYLFILSITLPKEGSQYTAIINCVSIAIVITTLFKDAHMAHGRVCL